MNKKLMMVLNRLREFMCRMGLSITKCSTLQTLVGTSKEYSHKSSVITVEHNHTYSRDKIKSLLESNGFVRVLSSISQFDDWYVKPKLMDNLRNGFSDDSII